MLKTFFKINSIVCLVFTGLLFNGCSKTEGTGGAATIEGKIMIQDYSQSTGLPNGAPYEGYDEDVYLVYGNGSTYSDDFKTSFDGSYRFTNLKKGTYKLFIYSDIVPEPSDPPKQEALIEVITITDKKGIATVPTITIKKS
jgi:hypothetical protein